MSHRKNFLPRFETVIRALDFWASSQPDKIAYSAREVDAISEPSGLSRRTRAFIAATEFSHTNFHLNADEALDLGRKLFNAYRSYSSNALSERMRGLGAAVLGGNRYPQQVMLHLHRLFFPQERMELAHARAHCWVADFIPQVTLLGSAFRHQLLEGTSLSAVEASF